MRFYELSESKQFKINQSFILSPANSHKIINVLRLQINDMITIFNNTNLEFTAKIINFKNYKKNIKLTEVIILSIKENNLESPIKINLVPAIAKNDNMDLIVQKATELGVNCIIPIITERTIIRNTRKFNHWQEIAVNACCQCGRNIVPVINDIVFFKEFIISNNINNNKFILSTDINNDFNLNNLALDIDNPIYLVVGPEGGFSLEELELAQKHQWLAINFGSRILRTETATIAAVSVFQAKWGDFRFFNTI